MTESTVFTELARIQQALKVPKGHRNDFGGYNYRSTSDILEAVKPHLGECSILLSDDMVAVADRIYVKAIATLVHPSGEQISVSAFAREALEKKKWDDAQITGGASSYARKYALSGLLAIDDTDDPDSCPPPSSGRIQKANCISELQRKRLFALTKEVGISIEQAKEIIAQHGFESTTHITQDKYDAVCAAIQSVNTGEAK